uniref:Innexin n=1 Tax=Panagrolaimus sp. PS1159 TaxID=55785 RepID=A0AC35FKK4_9BILA
MIRVKLVRFGLNEDVDIHQMFPAKPVEIDTFIASQLVDFQAFKIRPTKVAFGWYLTAIYLGMKLSIDWRVNGYFPRVTFCDLETRDLGQHRPHTIQCVLMLNMFIEKIYLFLWAWFLVTFAITVINILYWCFRIFSRGKKLSMINEALVQSGISDPNERDARDIEYFIRHDLRYDGIVLLRLIDSNFGYINMSNVCKQLWESFKKTQE